MSNVFFYLINIVIVTNKQTTYMKEIVFITWWATWIWAACAKKFTNEGFKVAINYLNSDEEAIKLQKELLDSAIFKWDMSEEKEIERVFDEIKNTMWEYPSILINNAWIVWRIKFPDLNWEQFANVLKVNTIWPYLVTREFIKRQDWKLDWKSIVFISSMRAYPEGSSPSSIDYSASKAAINNMVSSLAKTIAPCRVNWVAPWFTKTHIHDANPWRLETEAQKSILKRYSMPEEIADSVFFLASKWATSITWEVLRVDNWRSILS